MQTFLTTPSEARQKLVRELVQRDRLDSGLPLLPGADAKIKADSWCQILTIPDDLLGQAYVKARQNHKAGSPFGAAEVEQHGRELLARIKAESIKQTEAASANCETCRGTGWERINTIPPSVRPCVCRRK